MLLVIAAMSLLGCGPSDGSRAAPALKERSADDGTNNARPMDEEPIGEEPPPSSGTITYATRLERASAVAVDNQWVYWTVQGRSSTDGIVMRAPKLGGAVETLASGLNYPNEILVDDDAIYWVEFLANRLWRLPKNGGRATVRVGAPHTFYGFAMDAAHLYWADNGSVGSSVWRVPKVSGAPEKIAAVGGSANRPVLDATNVYLHVGVDEFTNMISSVPKSGGPVTVVADSAFPPIAVDETSLYLVLGILGPGVVNRRPKTGGTPVILAESVAPWGSIAQDDVNLYWGTYTELLGVPKAGGVVRVIAAGQDSVSGIAVDATRIYWTEYGSEAEPTGAVHSVLK